MNHEPFLVPREKKVRLSDFDPGFTGKFRQQEEAREKLATDIEQLAKYQDILYTQDTKALLVIFQALDAEGQ